MKLIWVLLVAFVTINITEAKSIVIERDVIENDVLIASKPLSYELNRKESIRVYPSIYLKNNNFVVDLKPTKKASGQTSKVEKHRKPFMKTVLVKSINDENIKVTIEVATRKSKTQRTVFTVKPNYGSTKTHKKNNGKIINFGKTKSEPNIGKIELRSDSKNKSLEEESQDINRHNTTIHNTTNHQDLVDFEKQNIRNKQNMQRRIKTLLLLSKRNNTNNLKVNPLNASSVNETSSNEVNDQNINPKTIEDKGNSATTPKVFIKSDYKDQLEEVTPPKENSTYNKKFKQDDTQDFNKNGLSANNHDDSETQILDNNDKGVQKSKTILLFPKRNYMNRLKENGVQNISQNKTNKLNDHNSNKKNNTITSQVPIASDSQTKLDKVIEPKKNFTDKVKKDEVVETQDVSKDGLSTNNHDFDEFETQNISHNHNEPIKSKTLIVFQKRNDPNHLKENTVQTSPENKTSSDKINHQNFNNTILDEDISKVSPKVFNNSDSKNKLKEVIAPKENLANQEKKDKEEKKKGFSKDVLNTNNHDFVDLKNKTTTQNLSNSHNELGKPNNKTNHLKEDSIRVSPDKMTSDEVNDQNFDYKIQDDEEITTNIPEELNEFDSDNKLDEVIEPKENFTDQDKKDKVEETQGKDGLNTINHDIVDLKVKNLSNNHNVLEKPNTLLPIRNKTNHLKGDTIQVSSDKMSSDELKDKNKNHKERTTIIPEELNKQDSDNKLEKVIEPKENFTDLEKRDKENETQGLSKDGLNTISHDFVDPKTQHISNNHNELGKPNTLLLFPKRNKTNHLKGDTIQLSSDKMSSDELKDKNFNDKNKNHKEKTTITPEVLNKLDSKNKLEEVIEPKENFADQEKKDEEEFINLKKVNQKAKPNPKHSDNSERAIRDRFRYYSFKKNKHY